MSFEDIIRDCKSKQGEIKVKNNSFAPLIEIKIDGKIHKYKVINNELVRA